MIDSWLGVEHGVFPVAGTANNDAVNFVESLKVLGNSDVKRLAFAYFAAFYNQANRTADVRSFVHHLSMNPGVVA